jgi:hypothetical protein
LPLQEEILKIWKLKGVVPLWLVLGQMLVQVWIEAKVLSELKNCFVQQLLGESGHVIEGCQTASRDVVQSGEAMAPQI